MDEKTAVEKFTREEVRAINARLKAARLKAGYDDPRQMLEAMGQPMRYFDTYKKHESGRHPPIKKANLYARTFGTTLDYIYFGIGGLDESENAPTFKVYPLLDANDWQSFEAVAKGLNPISENTLAINSKINAIKCIGITVDDKSMTEPGVINPIKKGDNVLVHVGANPSPGGIVLALLHEDRRAVLRVYRDVAQMPDGRVVYELRPLHPDFRPLRVMSPRVATILGTAVHVQSEWGL